MIESAPPIEALHDADRGHEPIDADSRAASVAARPVEFPSVSGERPMNGRMPLDRFYDVSVTVAVELGRVAMPIGDLVRLGEGSVIELQRGVSEPVDIMAQGVQLARGDIVAVDGRYAVRISEVTQSDPRSDARNTSRTVVPAGRPKT
jgi:flagellar motor switch protein FliN/FliY